VVSREKIMIEEKYKAMAAYVESGVEAIRRTGLRVLEMRDRYVKTLMPLTGNVNHVGIMYAGSLFTIGECMGGAIYGVAFDYRRFFPIVKEITIRFRRPVVTDVTLEVEMGEEEADRIQREAEEKGKADYTLDLDLKDASGETVCVVQGVWQIRKLQEGMASPFPIG
jgi:Putative thioesterase (yiiD_Cterm)